MKSRIFLIPAILLVHNSAAQITVTLQCSSDAAIGYHDGANTSGNNYGGAPQNAAFVIPGAADPQGTNGNRALFDFPLSSLPAGASVLSASLNLYALGTMGVLSGHTGTANTCHLRRVTQSWQEYGVTWNNQPSSSSLNQLTLQQSSTATQDYVNINALALVQDALANASSSFGFLLKLAVEAPSNGLLFASRENTDPAKRPTLVVTYTLCGQTASLSAGPATVCAGENYFLNAYASGGTPVWYNAHAPTVSVATGAQVQMQAPYVNATTVYTFQAGNSNCPSLPKSSIQITVHPLPALVVSAPSTVCAGQGATLVVSGAATYTWSSPSGFTGNNAVFPAIQTMTTFSVTGAGVNKCVNTATGAISVVECVPTSLTENASQVSVLIFPNPSNGQCYLRNQSEQTLSVKVIDVLGRCVRSVLINSGTVSELRDLPRGTYFFLIPGEKNQLVINKVVITD